jgi:hypothetical protein
MVWMMPHVEGFHSHYMLGDQCSAVQTIACMFCVMSKSTGPRGPVNVCITFHVTCWGRAAVRLGGYNGMQACCGTLCAPMGLVMMAMVAISSLRGTITNMYTAYWRNPEMKIWHACVHAPYVYVSPRQT